MANNIYKTGGTCFRFKALAGTGGVTKGYFVSISSNTVVNAAARATVAGIALTTAADGSWVEVIYGPVIVKGTAATSINFGHLDPVYMAASNELTTGTSGDKSCGRVVETDPPEAGTVYFVLHTPALTDTVTRA
jgi:hypothetical protein